MKLEQAIYSLRTAEDFRKSDYAKVFTELESIAKVQSVKSSNAIEGIVTSDQRIASIVNQSSAPLNHDEAEIAGYRDALNMIHTGYEHLSFNEKTILLLHETKPILDDTHAVLTAHHVIKKLLRRIAEILQHLLAEIVRRQHERPRGLHKPRAQPHVAVVVLHA